MFTFQQTPYDPRTIAGRIFLRRVHWIADYVGRNGRRGRVLEVGCEAGGLLRHLPSGWMIVGLDLSRAALATARSALGRSDVGFVHADATRPLPFPEDSFDYVIASEVLEHCRSPHRVIAQLHGVLKRDGRAIVSIPNERRYLKWKSWLARLPLARLALRGIEAGPAAWHIHHDFDREKLDALIDGFFEVELETSIWGTTLISVLRKI
jgi:SAM-dependent methyltransferase